MTIVIAVFLAIPVLLLVGIFAALLWQAIRRKHQWGVFFSIPRCVRCGESGTRRPVFPGAQIPMIWACYKCGLESNALGEPVAFDWRPPAPWIVLPAKEAAVLPDPDTNGKDSRFQTATNGIHRGR